MRDRPENTLTQKIDSIDQVVGGLDGKYHTISKNLNYVMIGVGLMALIALVSFCFFRPVLESLKKK